MLSEDRLNTTTDTFHDIAAQLWLEAGESSTTLIYLPETGEPAVSVLLGGRPPSAKQLARTARKFKAQALILTGEAWAAPLPTANVADLPAADRPRASELPERYSVIFTVAVRADGLTVLRQTRLNTAASGRSLTPGTLTDPGALENGVADLLRDALTRAHHRY